MPFRISRRLWMGGRPPGFTTGTSGFRCSHSGSVRSVSYGLRQVIDAHQHTGPTLFKRPLKADKLFIHLNDTIGNPLSFDVKEAAREFEDEMKTAQFSAVPYQVMLGFIDL